MPTIVFPPAVPSTLVIGAPQDDARMHLPTDRVSLGMTLTRLDATHVRADFSRPVRRIPTLLYPGAWVLSPPLEVIAVSAPAGTEVSQCTLTTGEQSPVVYTGTVYGVEVA